MESPIAISTLIYLGVAIIVVPLVKRWGLSSVIGYILGGILIGPFVLKLTGSDSHDIMEASEFGVILLLFIVGLEMEPRKFWSMRKKILGLGISQMLITIALLFGIFMTAKWNIEQAITISICFAMSSTAIVLQTIQEKNLFRTSGGQASFATLLFQDITLIPVLALIPIIAHREIKKENEVLILIQKLPEWLQTTSVLLGVVILILLGRYVFIPFLRYVSKAEMPELLTASSLFLVVGVSELMSGIGLSPALGAFIAGVMLANSEFRHELEAQIEPFKGLLLAVFFISVGATINFHTIKEDPLFIFSTVIVVLLVKFSVLFGIGKFFKIGKLQNYFYAFALSQIGEFAFVLINFSEKLYLFNAKESSQFMAVTAITMCVTPFLFIIYDRFLTSKINAQNASETPFNILEQNIPQKKIIIVGFGFFGSTIGRLLKASKISATILDHDTERVKLLRSYGFKVYYGDATRIQILRAAGIEDAEILALCLDSTEANKYIAEYVREHYPKIKIFVRAKNQIDAYYYLEHGIENIYRETLGTAVDMAVDLLHETGMRKYTARRLGKRFTLIDKNSVRKLAESSSDDSITFTMKEELAREEALLAYDNLNFEAHSLLDDDLDEDDDSIAVPKSANEL